MLAAVPAAAQPAAVPAPAQPASITQNKAELADRLTRQLGGNAAGAYLDRASGSLVVNVTSADAARQVRAAGAQPRTVDDSIRKLRRIQNALDRAGGVTGASWGVDVQTNSVVVNVPRGRDDARTRAFLRRASSYGDAVRIERVPGAVRPMLLRPGDAIHTSGSRCSAAFTVRGQNEYVLTAGHCTDIGNRWTTSSGQLIGNTALSSFPGNDYGFIQVANPGALGATNGSISRIGRPPVGSQVCKRGSTTGTTCGQILGYNQTVNYPQGTVFGLIVTNVCVQPGDSGGALYRSSTGVGITSGGTTGGCGGFFRSFFQPADEPIDRFGLSLK